MLDAGHLHSSGSPQLRSSKIIPSFLRGKQRGASQTLPLSTSPEALASSAFAADRNSPPSPSRQSSSGSGSSLSQANHSDPANFTPSMTPGTGNGAHNNNSALTQILRRRRSGGNIVAVPAAAATTTPIPAPTPRRRPVSFMPGAVSTPATNPTHFPLAALRRSSPSPPVQALPSASAGATTTTATPPPPPTHHLIRLVPQLESRHSLRFDPISRSLKPGDNPIRIGRFTDRSGLGLAALAAASQSSSKLAFRSKVVSRAHAELWVDAEGKFWIRDTKSSSGTFLNGVRLSVAGEESKEWCVRDGDMIQLGVDYQGGEEDVYKSVKMRVEVGREWQRGVNKFNSNAMKNLKALANTVAEAASETCATGRPTGKSLGLPDCCICLFPVSIRQALFLAPCSHTFHYKCIRPVIHSHWPGFCCPLCRTFADLEEEVEVECDEEGNSIHDDKKDRPLPNGDEEIIEASVPGRNNPFDQHDGDRVGTPVPVATTEEEEEAAIEAALAASRRDLEGQPQQPVLPPSRSQTLAPPMHQHTTSFDATYFGGFDAPAERDSCDAVEEERDGVEELVDMNAEGSPRFMARRHSLSARRSSGEGSSHGEGSSSGEGGAETEVEGDFVNIPRPRGCEPVMEVPDVEMRAPVALAPMPVAPEVQKKAEKKRKRASLNFFSRSS